MKIDLIIVVISFSALVVDSATHQPPKVIEGDISMTKSEIRSMQKAIQFTGGTRIKIWEKGIVPYEISREFGKTNPSSCNNMYCFLNYFIMEGVS
jgi:hypothetical protein